jgi:CDP-diacylglycerol--serine O-phosphatidyltransferase
MGVPKLDLRERLINRTDGRPRRAAYALPTLFTAGHVFLGYLAILRAIKAASLAAAGAPGAEAQWEASAIAIGVAAFLDGLDGRIARLTNTTSDFGREMDSLADVISFGIAPAVLAFTWGVQFVNGGLGPAFHQQITNAGYLVAFLFLLCGAARLARFNVQVNPIPKNPGRPDRKYFVGLPIPAGAAMVAAVVYAADSTPLRWWPLTAAWILLLLILSFLMISTWRYYSFKGISLLRPRSYLTIVAIGAMIYLIWSYSQVVLLLMASTYVTSGIVTRVGGVLRRRVHRPQPPRAMENPVG